MINPASLPDNEKERLEFLRDLCIMDTLPEADYDRITKLTAKLIGVPICLVTLLDESRQWFKSTVGVEVKETSREVSFCQYALHQQNILEVPNAQEDPRFAGTPLVADNPYIRFYAGAPLIMEDGLVMGTLCVIDTKPKALSEDQREILTSMAATISSLISNRIALHENDVYRNFFQKAGNLTAIMFGDFTVKSTNHIMEERFCEPSESMEGLNFCNFAHTDDLATFKAKAEQVQHTNQTGKTECRFLDVNGEEIYLECNIYYNETFDEFYLSAKDVTLEKELSRQLTKSEFENRILVESSTSLIIQFSVDGIVQRVNPTVQRELGYTSQELIGKPLNLLCTNESHSVCTRYLQEVIDKGTHTAVVRMYSKEGQPSDWNLSSTLVELGKDKFIVAYAQDFTEHLKLEAELKEKKQLAEEQSSIKDAFLANMSHEIRTPLNAIQGFCDLLIDTSITDEQRSYLLNLQSAGKNLLSIINDVLELSKLATGGVQLKQNVFSVADLMKEVCSMFGNQAKVKELALNYEVDPNVPAFLKGDIGKLTQILNNLIGNALKFTSQGGVFYSVHANQIKDGVCELDFMVKDTGRGVSKVNLSKIFGRFEQVNERGIKNSGVGLGLSITKEFIDAMKGSISVSSNAGKGSVFRFTIPFGMVRPNEMVKMPKKQPNLMLNNLMILLAEDNDLNALMTQKLLEKMGHSVHRVADGRAVFEIDNIDSFDLIMLDMQMPYMDGIEVAKRLRRDYGPLLKLMLQSANPHAEDLKNGEIPLFDSHLLKPFSFQTLIFEMSKLFKNKPLAQKRNVEKLKSIQNSTDNFLFDKAFMLSEIGGNKGQFVSLLGLFSDKVPEMMYELQAHIEDENYDKARKQAHRLKSSFGVLRANKGVELSGKIEKADDLVIRQLMEELKRYYSELESQIATEIKKG